MKKEVIFVDCFNTIIGRKCSPNYVVYTWAIKMNKRFENFSVNQFYCLFYKVWAEYKRVTILEKENSEFLIHINDIFYDMFDVLNKYGFIKNVDKVDFGKFAYDEYFNAEAKSHYLKKNIYKYLLKQKSQGKKIYLVSDFYTTKEEISKWLIKLGVDIKIFDEMFVSYDVQKSKNTGSIYKFILETLHLNSKKVIMVGDNTWADGKMSKKYGISYKFVFKPIAFERKCVKKAKHKVIVPQQYLDIFNQGITNSSYPNNAFPLFLFIKRLAKECEKKNIKNLFFLSRDGKFLKNSFDAYKEHYNLSINTHYLVASRKSVLGASCKDNETSFKGLTDKNYLTIQNVLKTLGFTPQETQKVIDDAKIKQKKIYYVIGKSKDFKAILQSKVFNELYDKKKEIKRKNYFTYLNSFGVDIEKEGFYIVDSGWLGNMQHFMTNCFAKDINTEGFYIGMYNKKAIQEKMYGLLFEANAKGLNYQNKILAYRRLNWEEYLKTETGSCAGYEDDGTPILEESNKETEVFYKYIEPLQKQMLEKFKQIMKTYDSVFCDYERVTTYLYYQMFKHTTPYDRKMYVEVKDVKFEGFGHYGVWYAGIPKFLRKFGYYALDKWFLLKNYLKIHKKRIF